MIGHMKWDVWKSLKYGKTSAIYYNNTYSSVDADLIAFAFRFIWTRWIFINEYMTDAELYLLIG